MDVMVDHTSYQLAAKWESAAMPTQGAAARAWAGAEKRGHKGRFGASTRL